MSTENLEFPGIGSTWAARVGSTVVTVTSTSEGFTPDPRPTVRYTHVSSGSKGWTFLDRWAGTFKPYRPWEEPSGRREPSNDTGRRYLPVTYEGAAELLQARFPGVPLQWAEVQRMKKNMEEAARALNEETA